MSIAYDFTLPSDSPYRTIALLQLKNDVISKCNAAYIEELEESCKNLSEDYDSLLEQSTQEARKLSLRLSLSEMRNKYFRHNQLFPGALNLANLSGEDAHDAIMASFHQKQTPESGYDCCSTCNIHLKSHAFHSCGHNICEECVTLWRTLSGVSTVRSPCPFCHKFTEMEWEKDLLVTRSGRRIRRKPYTRGC